MVTDLQGFEGPDGYVLTDPVIHTAVELPAFPELVNCASANLHDTGMLAFLKRHKCNSVCAALGLAEEAQVSPDRKISRNGDFSFCDVRLETKGHTCGFLPGSEPRAEG